MPWFLSSVLHSCTLITPLVAYLKPIFLAAIFFSVVVVSVCYAIQFSVVGIVIDNSRFHSELLSSWDSKLLIFMTALITANGSVQQSTLLLTAKLLNSRPNPLVKYWSVPCNIMTQQTEIYRQLTGEADYIFVDFKWHSFTYSKGFGN